MITVLCSDTHHPAWPHLVSGCKERGYNLVSRRDDLNGGEFLFLVSCTEIIQRECRVLYDHVLVLHESDVPKGRGWSPLAWQVLEGRTDIKISLLVAADRVDSGDVWEQRVLHLEGHELADEIHSMSTRVKFELMDDAVRCQPEPKEQSGAPTYYERRTYHDSRLDPNKSLADQFNLLRICEPRFPAFFDFRGHRYKVTLTKA